MDKAKLAVGLLCAALGGAATGCGDDTSDCGAGCAGAGGGSGGSRLDATALSYTEMQENNPVSAPEMTGYVLDADGVQIHGSFEDSAPTSDAYQFNTGTFGGATSPDHPGAWVQVLIDGRKVGTEDGIFLSLDAVEDDGWSALTGGSFDTGAVTRGTEYVLNLTSDGSLAGQDYIIEMRGDRPAP